MGGYIKMFLNACSLERDGTTHSFAKVPFYHSVQLVYYFLSLSKLQEFIINACNKAYENNGITIFG